jgi:hypothetical protein
VSGSSSSNEGANVFEHETKTTVIVPALGPDMGELYADGQIKLLARNVRMHDISLTRRLDLPADNSQSSGHPLIVDCISSLDFRNVSTIVIVLLESLDSYNTAGPKQILSLYFPASPRLNHSRSSASTTPKLLHSMPSTLYHQSSPASPSQDQSSSKMQTTTSHTASISVTT